MAGLRRKLRRFLLRNGRLESSDTVFDALFPQQFRVERLATGFQFTEGPVWLPDERALLFTDIPADRIYKLKPGNEPTVFRDPSHHANGLTLDGDGHLIACEHGARRVTRTEHDGAITVLADACEGKRLNSPNDVVVHSDGSIWFTDPPYGIRPEEQELPYQAVFRVRAGGGRPAPVILDLSKPNGLAFSPDETVLYVDDSSRARRHVRSFRVNEDGSLTDSGGLFHDMNVRAPGAPDGMKLDVDGRVWCTGARGIWVLSPDGDLLGTIVLPEKPSNCAWGGEDGRTLYITAETSVYRVRTNAQGIRPGNHETRA